MTRLKAIYTLKNKGIEIKANKVSKEEFRKAFGAKYSMPEWIVLSDYDDNVKVPKEYLAMIQAKETEHGRVILPTSFILGNFGQYLSKEGGEVSVLGLLYQYSLESNPRNISYAYRLFVGTKNVARSAGISTIHGAKEECAIEAKNVIEDKLFDLN